MGYGYECLSSHMDYRIQVVVAKNLIQGLGVGQVGLNEDGIGMNGLSVSRLQVVQGNNGVTLIDEYFGHDATDIARCTGHQNVH